MLLQIPIRFPILKNRQNKDFRKYNKAIRWQPYCASRQNKEVSWQNKETDGQAEPFFQHKKPKKPQKSLVLEKNQQISIFPTQINGSSHKIFPTSSTTLWFSPLQTQQVFINFS